MDLPKDIWNYILQLFVNKSIRLLVKIYRVNKLWYQIFKKILNTEFSGKSLEKHMINIHTLNGGAVQSSNREIINYLLANYCYHFDMKLIQGYLLHGHVVHNYRNRDNYGFKLNHNGIRSLEFRYGRIISYELYLDFRTLVKRVVFYPKFNAKYYDRSGKQYKTITNRSVLYDDKIHTKKDNPNEYFAEYYDELGLCTDIIELIKRC